MSNPSEELSILREDCDVSLQRALEIQSRLEPIEIFDDTRQVHVRIHANGTIDSVRIGITWDRVISPSQLAHVVLDTVSAAQMRRLEQFGSYSRQVEEEATPRARPASTTIDTAELIEVIEYKLANSDASAALAHQIVTELLDDTLEGITEADQLLSEHANQTFAGQSANRKVESTHSSSGELLGLDIDDAWLRSAHPANLGREITQAIHQGSRTAEAEGISAALSATKLAKAALAASDPATILDARW